MTRRSLTLFLLAILLTSPALAIDSEAPRPFSPVQGGPVLDAEDVLPYAADRLLVKFSEAAMAKGLLDVAMTKGTRVPDGLTGLASVDARLAQARLTSIERPFIEPRNTAKAGELGVERWFMIRVAEGDVATLAADLERDSSVQAVSFDWRAFPAAIPNDPYHDDNWGHDNTAQLPEYDWNGTWDHTGSPVGTVGFDANAQTAWDASQGYGDSGVIIAIIDSGVDVDHDDLRLVPGYDYGDNDSNPDDNSADPGHGTCCAGVAAAIVNNGSEANGVAGGCSVMPLKIANSAGSMYFSAIVNAIYHAADNGADIISMSLGAPISSDAATDAALEYAQNAGCTILAATGNENDGTISYPAIHSDVIGVGAASPCGERKRSSSSSTECNPGVSTDPNGYTCDGERWWGSNYGVATRDAAGAVDILGPTILPTTDIEGSGGYRSGDVEPFFNGTSCSTPYVAGVAALVKSQNPSWTPTQIRDRLCDTAEDVTSVESGSGWDRYAGYGMVDAAAAVGGGGPAVPMAAFVGSPTSGLYPLNVSFTDQSSNTPTSWHWTFGDGGTATAQNPSHTYTGAGTYTVTLTATNAAGSDDETKTNYISVTAPAPPVAAFSAAPTSGVYPLDVAFTDGSTGSPASWSWDFGDGGTSSLQNPSHTYTTAGSYTVTLTATSPYGSDDEVKIDHITVTEPGVTTYVTASGETAVTGAVVGTYAATAQSDDTHQTITEVQYTGHPRKTYSYLEHRWSFDLPAGGDATFHLEVSRASNTDGDDFVFEYSTDGATWLSLATVASATEQTYSAALGTLSGAVTVRVTDSNRSWGNLSMDSVSIDWMAFELGDVQPVSPTADFAGTPTAGEYPLVVQFNDLSTGDPTGWSWGFGDGGGATTQNPQHTYTVAGVYTVSLTATNAQGEDTAVKTDYITVTEPGQGGTALHVDAMSVARRKVGPNYLGTCVVTIVNDTGQPVADATVSATYDGPTSGSDSGVTAADGTVTLESVSMKKPTGEWCFEVTSVTHGTLAYVSGDNVVTRACESGSVFSANKELLRDVTLMPNSPNPFNPVTELSFSLPRSMQARLTIYDARGGVAAVLVDGERGAGVHRVIWDARHAPSGVYFSQLVTGDTVLTRKMILLK